jgi:prefoldin subunit 5
MMFDLTDFEKGLGNFSDRVEIIVGLEIGDKLSSDEAYKMIKEEFKKLKKLRKEN